MFNEFGTPMGVESESMLPPGQNRLTDRMLAESGIEMNWFGVAVGVASMASSWMGAQKQASNQQAAADRNRSTGCRRHDFAQDVTETHVQIYR